MISSQEGGEEPFLSACLWKKDHRDVDHNKQKMYHICTNTSFVNVVCTHKHLQDCAREYPSSQHMFMDDYVSGDEERSGWRGVIDADNSAARRAEDRSSRFRFMTPSGWICMIDRSRQSLILPLVVVESCSDLRKIDIFFSNAGSDVHSLVHLVEFHIS
jgi:hypothetical protein